MVFSGWLSPLLVLPAELTVWAQARLPCPPAGRGRDPLWVGCPEEAGRKNLHQLWAIPQHAARHRLRAGFDHGHPGDADVAGDLALGDGDVISAAVPVGLNDQFSVMLPVLVL